MAGGEGAKERRRLKRVAALEGEKNKVVAKSPQTSTGPDRSRNNNNSNSNSNYNNNRATRSPSNRGNEYPDANRRNSNGGQQQRFNNNDRNNNHHKPPKYNPSKYNNNNTKKVQKTKIKKPKHLKRKLEQQASTGNEEVKETIQKELEQFESKKKLYSNNFNNEPNSNNNNINNKRLKTTAADDDDHLSPIVVVTAEMIARLANKSKKKDNGTSPFPRNENNVETKTNKPAAIIENEDDIEMLNDDDNNKEATTKPTKDGDNKDGAKESYSNKRKEEPSPITTTYTKPKEVPTVIIKNKAIEMKNDKEATKPKDGDKRNGAKESNKRKKEPTPTTTDAKPKEVVPTAIIKNEDIEMKDDNKEATKPTKDGDKNDGAKESNKRKEPTPTTTDPKPEEVPTANSADSSNDDDDDDDTSGDESMEEDGVEKTSSETVEHKSIPHDASKGGEEESDQSSSDDDDDDDDDDSDDDDDDDEPEQKRQRGRGRKGRQDTAKKIEEMEAIEKIKTDAASKSDPNSDEANKGKKRYCLGRKPVSDFTIGQSHVAKVVYVKPFGVFFDIGCHSDAFCHVSRLSDDFVESSESMFKEGDDVPNVRIVEIDRRAKRITVSLQSEARIEDERKSIDARKSRKEKKRQKAKKTEAKKAAGGGGGQQSGFSSSTGSGGPFGQDRSKNQNNFNNESTSTRSIPKNEPVVVNRAPPRPAPPKKYVDPSMMAPADLKRARKLARRAERRAQGEQQG